MNYLAHLYLSGTNPSVKVGNFIGDYVKGRNYLRYSSPIQKGILLHRQIDTFTDKHPVSKESGTIFKPMYKRYSGVVTDVIYDHFLASNWGRYSDETLKHFVSQSHRILMSNYFTLPGVVKQFLPFLIQSRRMEFYRKMDGVHKTLHIMAGHSSLPDHSNWAMEQLEHHYDYLQSLFFIFFDEAIQMSQEFLNEEWFMKRPAM